MTCHYFSVAARDEVFALRVPATFITNSKGRNSVEPVFSLVSYVICAREEFVDHGMLKLCWLYDMLIEIFYFLPLQ